MISAIKLAFLSAAAFITNDPALEQKKTEEKFFRDYEQHNYDAARQYRQAGGPVDYNRFLIISYLTPKERSEAFWKTAALSPVALVNKSGAQKKDGIYQQQLALARERQFYNLIRWGKIEQVKKYIDSGALYDKEHALAVSVCESDVEISDMLLADGASLVWHRYDNTFDFWESPQSTMLRKVKKEPSVYQVEEEVNSCDQVKNLVRGILPKPILQGKQGAFGNCICYEPENREGACRYHKNIMALWGRLGEEISPDMASVLFKDQYDAYTEALKKRELFIRFIVKNFSKALGNDIKKFIYSYITMHEIINHPVEMFLTLPTIDSTDSSWALE